MRPVTPYVQGLMDAVTAGSHKDADPSEASRAAHARYWRGTLERARWAIIERALAKAKARKDERLGGESGWRAVSGRAWIGSGRRRGRAAS